MYPSGAGRDTRRCCLIFYLFFNIDPVSVSENTEYFDDDNVDVIKCAFVRGYSSWFMGLTQEGGEWEHELTDCIQASASYSKSILHPVSVIRGYRELG